MVNIDYDFKLESAAQVWGMVLIVMIPVLGMSRIGTPEIPFYYYGGVIILLLIAVQALFNIDQHLRADLVSGNLDKVESLLFTRRRKTVGKLSEAAFLAIDCKISADQRRFTWIHCIIIAFRNGKTFQLSKYVVENREGLEPYLENLSDALGVPICQLPKDKQWMRDTEVSLDAELTFRDERQAKSAYLRFHIEVILGAVAATWICFTILDKLLAYLLSLI
jgi:hypothetical protein